MLDDVDNDGGGLVLGCLIGVGAGGNFDLGLLGRFAILSFLWYDVECLLKRGQDVGTLWAGAVVGRATCRHNIVESK